MSYHLAHNNPYILSSRREPVPASDVHENYVSWVNELVRNGN